MLNKDGVWIVRHVNPFRKVYKYYSTSILNQTPIFDWCTWFGEDHKKKTYSKLHSLQHSSNTLHSILNIFGRAYVHNLRIIKHALLLVAPTPILEQSLVVPCFVSCLVINSVQIYISITITKSRKVLYPIHFYFLFIFGFLGCFIMDLQVHQDFRICKFEDVNPTDRRWRTRKMEPDG